MLKFREKALARHREADRLDELMRVTKPRAWLGAAALALAVAALLVWSFVGSVPQTESARGVIGGRSGVTQVESTGAGAVSEVMVQPGEQVDLDEPVLKIDDPAGRSRLVRAKVSGKVVAVQASSGRVVEPGTPLFTIQPPRSRNEPLYVFLFLDPDQAARVFPNMSVTVGTLNYGNLSGVVEEVQDAPASTAELERVTGNDLLVSDLAKRPRVLARVTVRGAVNPRLTSGALVNATITLRDRRPIDVVFG